LVIDAWEHAYYLQYHTEKARFFAALWNLWNWDDVAARYSRAQSVDLGLTAAAGDSSSEAVAASPMTH
jgi:Fe-Mn family superoxide dismutase